MIRLVVDSRIRCHGLPPGVAEVVRREFTHANPKHFQLKKIGRGQWREPAKIGTWRDDDSREVSVPRGGMARVRAILRTARLEFEEVDCRLDVGLIFEPYESVFELRDYQAETLEAAVMREQGIIRSPTGSGKTVLALALAARLGQRTIVVVNSGGLLRQWVAAARAQVPDAELGLVGEGQWDPGPLTLAMQQTLAAAKPDRLRALTDVFGVLIADEIQFAAAKTYTKVFDQFPARYRFGFSADQRRPDRKEFLVHDLFGDVIADIKSTDLVAGGHIHEVEVRLIETEFVAPWWREALVAGQTPDRVRLIDEIVRDDERTLMAVERVAAAAQSGKRCLVFTARVDHARIVEAMLAQRGVEAGLMLGGAEWRRAYEQSRADLSSGAIRVAVGTTQAVGTGIDLPTVDAGFVLTPIGSRQPWGQVRGRICRTSDGKSAASIDYLADFGVFGVELAKRMKSWNRSCVVIGREGAMISVAEWIASRRSNAQSQAAPHHDNA